MIQFKRCQYDALKAFSSIIKRELSLNGMRSKISQTIILLGQEYGFCNDEIREIIDYCSDDLKSFEAK